MTLSRTWMTLALMLLVTAGAVAGDPRQAFTDPAQAGPDFVVQGEYVGTTKSDDGDKAFGIQVIALGDGQFNVVGYPGGLPGAGYDGGDRMFGTGKTEGDVVNLFSKDCPTTATIKDGVITVSDPDGGKVGQLKKVLRESPTLGQEPPTGAIVLFDGTSPDAFRGGRMTEDGLLMEGVTSKQTFGDHAIHIEFRSPFQPFARGQGRGNSGFYAQGRYEVQILDSFGLEGEWNECGGVYKIAKPDVNMCLPPLSWQTYDIDFTAAKYVDGKKTESACFTVRHNGVLIHENVELPHATTASPSKDGPELGPVFLQNHGNPVRFRNIWVTQGS